MQCVQRMETITRLQPSPQSYDNCKFKSPSTTNCSNYATTPEPYIPCERYTNGKLSTPNKDTHLLPSTKTRDCANLLYLFVYIFTVYTDTSPTYRTTTQRIVNTDLNFTGAILTTLSYYRLTLSIIQTIAQFGYTYCQTIL